MSPDDEGPGEEIEDSDLLAGSERPGGISPRTP